MHIHIHIEMICYYRLIQDTDYCSLLCCFFHSVVSDPFVTHMDCSPPSSSVHGIFWARSLDGLPFRSLGDLPDPGIESTSPCMSFIAGRFFTAEPVRKVLCGIE